MTPEKQDETLEDKTLPVTKIRMGGQRQAVKIHQCRKCNEL